MRTGRKRRRRGWWVSSNCCRLVASILELGCGAGNHSAVMLAAGFAVRATDGSPEMAAIASRRLGHPVEAMLFDELDAQDAYDGVWASACLLHVPRDELESILARIHRALKPSGVFYASFKIGEGDGRDNLGRYYNYPSPEWLQTTYAAAGRGIRWYPTPASSRVLTRRPPICCI